MAFMTYCKVVSSNTSRLEANAGFFIVGHHIKLEIRSFVNVKIRAGRHLKGFGQAPLSGARRGYMPPRLKTKTNKHAFSDCL